MAIILSCTTISSTNATLFKYKIDKKQELLDHLKKKQRSLSHTGYDDHQHQIPANGGYFGFSTGYENLFGSHSPYAAFKHAYPVAYHVPKLVPIPHPVPVTVERPVAIPVPIHFGHSAYDTALANYAVITQHQQNQHHINNGHYQLSGGYGQYNGHYNQQQQQHQGHYGGGYGAAVYEQDCHPYCDINLPQGSSPVPLISKEKRMKKKENKQEKKMDQEDQKMTLDTTEE